MSVDLERIASEWLKQCGPCDFGLPEYGCACPEGDPRPVVASLVTEVERLRAALADQVEHTKHLVRLHDEEMRQAGAQLRAACEGGCSS